MGTVQNVDIREWYDEAKEAWGEHALPPLEEIRVTLQPNMTKAGGRAFPKCFRRRNGQVVDRDWYGITLSKPWFQALLAVAPEEFAAEFRDVVLHELAHIACYYVYPAMGIGHGWQWKSFCKLVGCRPTRYIWEGYAEDAYIGTSGRTWADVMACKEGLTRR